MSAQPKSWDLYPGGRWPACVSARAKKLPPCGCGCGGPAIWVGPGSKYANPFRAGRRIVLEAEEGRITQSMEFRPKTWAVAVDLYEDLVTGGLSDPILGINLVHSEVNPEVIRAELAGHDLACDCSTMRPCHSKVLRDIANSQDLR